MRTRIRFTTADGTPLTYEAGGKTFTMDRVMHVVDDREGRCQIECRAHDLHHLLAESARIDYDAIVVHLDPLPGPSPDAAELAALLGDA